MEPYSLKQAVIKRYNLEEHEYESFALNRTLFFRVKVVRPIVRFINTDFLFNENRLIQQLGKTTSMREVSDEIDFYQHKFVAGYLMKEALKFRISGMRVIRLAKEVFQAQHAEINNTGRFKDQESPSS